MKKTLFILAVLTVMCMGLFGQTRTYTQKVLLDTGGNPTGITNTLNSTTAPNYIVEAYLADATGTPLGFQLSTDPASPNWTVPDNLRLKKFSATSDVRVTQINIHAFSAYSTFLDYGGKRVYMRVIYTGVTPNESSVWWYKDIPTGTLANFSDLVVTQTIPPFTPAGFNLIVTSTPAGATIIKDGTPTAFTTPHTFFPGEAGTYTLGAMAGYTPWTPTEYVVPALTADQTIDFQATLIPPDTYALTVNAVGPASMIYKDGISTSQIAPFTFSGATAAELTGVYTMEALPAGFYWDPASITVVAGDFTSGKGMGSRSNGAKTVYTKTITFSQMAYPTYTLNVNGPDGYAVTGPVNGTTDYVATDNNNMVNDLLGQYTIAAAPAGYVWAVNPITVSETNFTANMATIEFVLNEIPPQIVPADETTFPAGYPTTYTVNNAYVVTGVGVHNIFIPRGPTDTAAWAWYNGMWNAPNGTPDWTWLNVNLSAKAPVPVVVLGPTLPVELSSFSAILTAQNFVKLTWVTESETNMNGYNVFRNETADYSAATHIGYTASTNSSTQHVYSLTDNEVETNNTYYYWLECVDFNGTSTLYGPQYVTVVGNDVPNLPTATALKNAYPNPFKTNTTIAVDVKEGENATVTIYNILGQAVMTYRVPAGSHNLSWNGRDSKGNACASGIYFYKLTSPTMNQTRKMVIVK